MTAPLRAHVVTFLNAQPLTHSLQGERAPTWDDGSPMFELTQALPSRCADALANGECDLALVPVAAYLEHPEWEVAAGLSIACRGPVETVVVAGEVPFEELEEIYLDGASRTSVLLLRVLLKAAGREPRLVPSNHGEGVAKIGGNAGALVIGDAAFGLKKEFRHVTDLGARWYEKNALPFVFAFWAARPGVLTPQIVAALQKARDRSLGKFAETIAAQYRQSRIDQNAERGVESENFYANYLRRTIRYNLETQYREGLIEFLNQARALRGSDGAHEDEVHIHFIGHETSGDADETSKRSSRRRTPFALQALLQKGANGERLSLEEGVFLYENAPLMALGEVADRRRQALHPDGVVTYIIDRNVNYTNVCVTRCKFCNFYVPPGRKDGYVLDREILAQKFRETEELGGIQILLQGGLNPELDLAYYEDLFRWTKANFKLKLHALSPTEIIHIAQIEELSIAEVLIRLRAAGMDSLPGGGAEILDDEVRNRISPFKNNTREWLEVMRQAHKLGMRSTATMVFGFQETTEQMLRHLDRIRSLQDETGGFTAFIAWPFQAEGTRLKLRDDTSSLRYLRVQALSRLYLDNVKSLQVSWPTLGPEVGEIALRFGANDFGSVMIEENVVSTAGAAFLLTSQELERHVHFAGFKVARRNMQYEYLTQPA
jgi:cyclic dehypoxanthinyl futalosine synthase